MRRNWKRVAICAAIVLSGVLITLQLNTLRFFQLLNLKAQDTNFIVRGRVPTKDILLLGIDNETLNRFPELSSFWHRYYADAIRGAAQGGAKVFVLDVTFAVPVTKYEPENDTDLAEALATASPSMPVIAAFVPEAMGAQRDSRFAVPFNMMASMLGTAAYANLTADPDDFVRRVELIEAPKDGVPVEQLARSMPLRAVEKYLGKDVQFDHGELLLNGRKLPVESDRALTINYAGPPGTFPRVSLAEFIAAVRKHDTERVADWVKDKIVLLGPDNIADRYDTPFYTFLGGDKFTTPGFEIHANAIRTLLTGDYLRPVPEWARVTAMIVAGALCAALVTSLSVSSTVLATVGLLFALLAGVHIFFRFGWLFSASEIILSLGWSLLGSEIYRFATAEKKSTFFRGAVELFVGKQVAHSLDLTNKISRTGQRRMVTVLFTDIRGFTAFCETRDPALVVELLNGYMSRMVSIIVKNGGVVNKFLGDGILAVFSDDDEGAELGDHAVRSTRCAIEMVQLVIGEFRTGAGLHSGEVVIGNVGSSDKLEFTVLGNTVNLASRLESLNKDQHTRLLMSEETREMLGGTIDTVYLGAVPVKGKTEKMKLFTVSSLLDEARLGTLENYTSLHNAEHAEPVS